MRELKEEELTMVHGGRANLSGLSLELLADIGVHTLGPDSILKQEFRAMERRKVHTLMDQMDLNS